MSADVIVVGGGIVGSALALALAQLPLRITLIDSRNINALPMPSGEAKQLADFDLRVSALTRASQLFLHDIGVWHLIEGARCCAYTGMQVWDAEGTGAIAFDAEQAKQDNLGHIVENIVVAGFLAQALQFNTRVNVITAHVVDAELNPAPRVILADGSSLSAQLLVAADGAMSPLREKLGFNTRERDYGHSAIVASVATELPHRAQARQRFLRSGPLAFLPMPRCEEHDHVCSIVWSADTDLAEQLMNAPDDHFASRLQDAFESRLGRVEAVSQRMCFPLRERHSESYIKAGAVLVGDAAHTIHPLAGQGLNLGLMDAQCLAREVTRALQRGLPIADLSVLRRFQRERKFENSVMMGAMLGFKALFAQTNPAVRWVRNQGMSSLNRHSLIKQQIVARALGV